MFGKGDFFFNKGQYNETLECYEELLKTFPNEEFILLRKVKILYKLNFDSRALEIVEKLLDLNKKNATAWYLKTFYFIRNKDYSNSLKCLDESLNSNPKDEKIWEAIWFH
ncbi:MAG TPA: hypothetical protein VFP49_06520 [Nitrososphaeraceae archaeon]|nr:hypothetical protein [Nitrososphaeraceae archaeon]